MRKTAITLAVLGILALVPPTTSADECQMNADEGVACVEIPVDNPGTPAGLPGVPPDAETYFGTYYLYVGAGDCAQSVISGRCRGTPVAGGSGVELPTGSAVGAGVFGLLYEESNSIDGLQRSTIILGGQRPADRTVLV